MPYIFISAVALCTNLYRCAPLIVGDKHADPELMKWLGAKITTDYPEPNSQPLYVMYAPMRSVLDALQKIGYELNSSQVVQGYATVTMFKNLDRHAKRQVPPEIIYREYRVASPEVLDRATSPVHYYRSISPGIPCRAISPGIPCREKSPEVFCRPKSPELACREKSPEIYTEPMAMTIQPKPEKPPMLDEGIQTEDMGTPYCFQLPEDESKHLRDISPRAVKKLPAEESRDLQETSSRAIKRQPSRYLLEFIATYEPRPANASSKTIKKDLFISSSQQLHREASHHKRKDLSSDSRLYRESSHTKRPR